MSKYKKVNVPIIVQLEEQEGGLHIIRNGYALNRSERTAVFQETAYSLNF